ncbi:hypothetical protein [Streptomyces sp. NPDC008141]|uniref:hypothetical protein n=1 Tax=Streptomyces sp. NPDC008141 TaxID=3364815 RepID=UPI0036E11810
MDAEVGLVAVSLLSSLSAVFGVLAGHIAARRNRLMAARIRAGEVIAYLTPPVEASETRAVCVVDNRASGRISNVVVRYQNSDLLELSEVLPRNQRRILVSPHLAPTASAAQTPAHDHALLSPTLAFSDAEGRRWTNDPEGLRLIEDRPARRTKLYSVPVTWLFWTTASAAFLTVVPLMLVILL